MGTKKKGRCRMKNEELGGMILDLCTSLLELLARLEGKDSIPLALELLTLRVQMKILDPGSEAVYKLAETEFLRLKGRRS